ncbi:MAG: hypothetical protein ACYS7Y_36185 [Planctomycetota bacterium]|jgi:hypothetical protein
MLCEIAIFATHDLDPMTEFPHEYSAWVDGGAVSRYFNSGDLSRQKYDGIEQTRSVTTEGLQSPAHGYNRAAPPKYPPHQLTGYRCDHTIIADIEAHADIVVLSIDTVDPADYDSLPVAMQDTRPDDPIKESVWTANRAWLIAVTPAENQDQVTAALDNWRADNPLGTARQFGIVVRNFTS